MKEATRPTFFRRWGAKLMTGLFLVCAAPAALAQTDLIVSIFETEDSASAWSRWWGAAPQTYEWDGTVNAGPDTNSGSLKATVDFDVAQYAGDNQFALQGDLGTTVDASTFTNLVFDINWDPSSPKQPSGDFGYLEYGFKNSDSSQTWLGAMNVPGDSSGWIHVVAPIDPTLPKLDQVSGVVLKMWSGDPTTGLTGTTVFWLDNVIMIANTNTAPVPPPTVTLGTALPGLQLFASAGGVQYQRQNIRTVGSDYSWVGQPGAVTYSLTLKSYPDAAHSGFQTHIFLVPSATPPTESSPDYNEPNVVFLDIGNSADGGAYANLRYKTNQPGGNSMIYNSDPTQGPVGTLATINSSTAIGTWSLTFTGDTNLMVTTPDGTTTNAVISAEAAALFANPLYAFFGVQPNSLSNVGQSDVFGRVQITGVTTPLDDNFAGVPPEGGGSNQLDPAVWQVVAQDPAGVVLVPTDSAYWAWWTLPAVGYTLQQNNSLTTVLWQDVTQPAIQTGPLKGVLLPSSSLPPGDSAYFRVIKPE